MTRLSTSCARFPLVFLGLALCAPVHAQAAEDHIVSFENGDVLHGRMVSATPQAGLHWERADMKTEATFPLASVLTTRRVASSNAPRPALDCVVRLTNGDELPANITALDDQALTLETPYAGRLLVSRDMVTDILPQQSTTLVFRGPAGLDDWTPSADGVWSYRDRALHAKGAGTVGRAVELPPRASIEFTVAWDSPYPQFSFAFLCSDLKSYAADSYTIRISNTRVMLHRYVKGRNSQVASAAFAPAPDRREGRFRLLIDRDAKTFVFAIDGKPVGRWVEDRDLAANGSGIVFFAYGGFPIHVSDIRVARWSGVEPDTTQELDPDQDHMVLVNDDRIAGRLHAVADHAVAFDTTFGLLSVPLRRISRLSLSQVATGQARRNANDIRIDLRDNGVITLDLDALTAGEISGRSENLSGNVKLKLQAVTRIDYNIYRDLPINRIVP